MSAQRALKPDTPAAPRRSGSEKRQRAAPVSVRLSPGERAAVEVKAREAGLSVGSFARASMLGEAGPRARRSPPINAELLAHAVAQLNKAGSNLNQIAHILNAGQAMGGAAIGAAIAEVRAAVARIIEATGRGDRE